MPPDQVEALAFAWLAACRLAERTASLPAVTGARGPRVLGAVYAATRRLGSDQAENDEPQPQVVVAFGFLITNCAPCRSSL
jgi:hypothetical protein